MPMSVRLDEITWARRLKLRHLEVLLVICEARSITAAAVALHMTQPAVSHWLADIEELVGQPLFVRGRQMRTTAAGDVLRRHAERMLGDVRRTNEDLHALGKGLAGMIRLGSIISAAPSLIPQTIARLQEEFPSLHVHVFFDPTFEQLLERLRKKELDLIIGPLDLRAQKSGFQSELLITDTVAIVISPGHPLARKRKPTWKELAPMPWIMPPAGTIMRQRVESAFLKAGVTVPAARIETASHVLVQMMLMRGTYVSALAGSVAPIYQGFRLMDIVKTPKLVFGEIGMLWDEQEVEPKLEKLISTLREEAKALR